MRIKEYNLRSVHSFNLPVKNTFAKPSAISPLPRWPSCLQQSAHNLPPSCPCNRDPPTFSLSSPSQLPHCNLATLFSYDVASLNELRTPNSLRKAVIDTRKQIKIIALVGGAAGETINPHWHIIIISAFILMFLHPDFAGVEAVNVHRSRGSENGKGKGKGKKGMTYGF